MTIFKENDGFLKIIKQLKLDEHISNGLKEGLIQERVESIIVDNHRYSNLVKNLRVNIDPTGNSNFTRINLSYNLHFPFLVEKEIVIVKGINKRLWNGGNNPAYLKKLATEDTYERGYYITNTGSKYHHEGCIYLKKSKVPIHLEDALERNYTPCKICIINGGTGHEN